MGTMTAGDVDQDDLVNLLAAVTGDRDNLVWAVRVITKLARLGILRTREVDDIEPSPRVRQLVGALDRAAKDLAMSPQRHPLATSAADRSPSRPVGSVEAASILGVSVKQAQRRAAELGAVKVSGTWWYDRDRVLAATRLERNGK